MKLKGLYLIIISIILSSCMTIQNGENYSARSNSEKEFNLGKVQKELKKGMSGAEVANILGSPNIVTKDENGKETWVYDRIATEANYANQSTSLILFFYNENTNASKSTLTQKTLTVVIKFNDKSQIDSFSYHISKF